MGKKRKECGEGGKAREDVEVRNERSRVRARRIGGKREENEGREYGGRWRRRNEKRRSLKNEGGWRRRVSNEEGEAEGRKKGV